MRTRGFWLLTILAASTSVVACGSDATTSPTPVSEDTSSTPPGDTDAPSDLPPSPDADAVAGEAVEPASPRLSRLTARQYRNAIRDHFGPAIVPPAALEPDASQDALIAIGSTLTSVSPRGVEQYFDAALSLAHQIMGDKTARAAVLPFTPSGPSDAVCAEEAIAFAAKKLLRCHDTETAGALANFKKAAPVVESFDLAFEYALAAMLQSPYFLYRVELGEDDPEGEGRRFTSCEMASRLSFFLWNSVPDDALRVAADAGELVTAAGVEAQVTRMLEDPRARDGVRNFFAEWLDLYVLDQLGKDPNVFKHFSADLGPAAREETLKLIEEWVFERDADYRTLYTTRTTFVNRRLAAIYEVPSPQDDGFAEIELPLDRPRRGVLGHVSFLAQQSHPTSSSATLRGKFIRQRLICGYVPPPPVNLNTAIPEPSETAKTLKERLIVHMQATDCNGCHSRTDPPGFALEQFDGIGRFRTDDNGVTIDPSGNLDTYSFADAVELAEVMANHPDLVPCVVKMVYSYAGGHLPTDGEKDQVSELATAFASGGHRVRQLFASVAVSQGFRRVGPLLPGEEVSQ